MTYGIMSNENEANTHHGKVVGIGFWVAFVSRFSYGVGDDS